MNYSRKTGAMQFIVIDLSCENAIAEGDPEGSLNSIVLWAGTGRSYFLPCGIGEISVQ